MKYLLDTNVVSALRVRGRNPPVEVWAASVPVGDQFVSAFTIAEIERDEWHHREVLLPELTARGLKPWSILEAFF